MNDFDDGCPMLTREMPGVGGVLRQRPADFVVDELPLYEPSGDGEHVMCEIEKTSIPTFDLVAALANALGVHQRDIGYAGLKDTHAVTRQRFTIPRVDPGAVSSLDLPNARVLWVDKHRNKLRLGHLAGNRFSIKIREVDPAKVVTLKPIVEKLQTVGMPNYFGQQRFGARGDNAALGLAVIRRDHEMLLSHLLGRPNEAVDRAEMFAARSAFEAGDIQRAYQKWPKFGGVERRVLARLVRTNSPKAAVAVIETRLKKFWVAALQSRLFNDVVAARIDELGKLYEGDFAYLHRNGRCFRVTNLEAEQPRADAFEISPTGPLLGYRVSLPTGRPLEIEQGVFDKFGLTQQDFRNAGRERAKGDRRPIRVKPEDVKLQGGVDEHGPYIAVAFTLPAGSFATVFLRELMKNPESPPGKLPQEPDNESAARDASNEASEV